jgi:hypothetical protein
MDEACSLLEMIRLTRILTVSLSLASVGACSAFDPKVGGVQGDGTTPAPACTLGAGGYGASYGSPNGQVAQADFCTADGGTLQGDCDVCEAMNCCAQRVACYTDQTCSCADNALDPCTSAVTDASANAASTLKACFTTFAASNTIASSRYQCLLKSCAAACHIPS